MKRADFGAHGLEFYANPCHKKQFRDPDQKLCIIMNAGRLSEYHDYTNGAAFCPQLDTTSLFKPSEPFVEIHAND